MIHVTRRLTDQDQAAGISALTLRAVFEYGLPFYTYYHWSAQQSVYLRHTALKSAQCHY